jgi:XTP/dITP diphosphohydrolase
MKIVLATRNPSKLEQIDALFSGSKVQILSLDDAHIEGEAVEDGATLKENAAKKAWYAHARAPHLWTVADDTGLFINSLGGEPGVHSARWAGPDSTTEDITKYCLQRMLGLADRSARFEVSVVAVSPEKKEYVFTGMVHGRMLRMPRVRAQPKMPYSPLFVPDGEDFTWAEMPVEYENRISHRGQAFRKLRSFLESRS